MPSSVEKARKQIAKKRGGQVNALHVKSRDSRRLHQAGLRDEKLGKLASARYRREQPIVERVAFFQRGLQESPDGVLDLASVQNLIVQFVGQYDQEYDDLKKSRRSGRAASVKEDLLRMKITALQTEYDNGFLLPDIMDAENAKKLLEWGDSWSFLATLPWIKVFHAGKVVPGDFPSKGIN